ncbi:MAG: hypothetical protein JWM60_316 [Solirubrobacterales bacterium]|nr:hypothetical protein [Solirubrobacterales bacterium]
MADQTKLANDMAAVSRAMVSLHKEQFGRGPTRARSHFSGRDALLCVLENALLPAEQKMVKLGEAQRVRESRIAFQVATADEFIAVVEQILYRKVSAFASAVDPENNVVFENFAFEPLGTEELGNDLVAPAAVDGHFG